jgi:hypothetical protein
MEIKIKTFSTWCNEHFVLYTNGNYAGSFDTYKEAEAHGKKLKESEKKTCNYGKNSLLYKYE